MFPGIAYYIVLFGIGLIDLLWLRMETTFALDPRSVTAAMFGALRAFTAILLLKLLYYWLCTITKDAIRAFGKDIFGRLIVVLEGITFLRLSGTVLLPFDSLLTTSNGRFQDLFMMRADRALHLDWQGYYMFFVGLRPLTAISENIYTLLWPVCVLVLAGLIALDRKDVAEFLFRATCVGAILTLPIGFFFPAHGPVIMELYNLGTVHETLHRIPGTYFVDYIQKLHNHIPMTIPMSAMKGVTFLPSFHTSVAVFMAYACRRTPLFWPVMFYAALVLTTVPVEGGHYFIDMISGALLAVVVMIAFLLTPRYRGLFDDRTAAPVREKGGTENA